MMVNSVKRKYAVKVLAGELLFLFDFNICFCLQTFLNLQKKNLLFYST